MKRAQLSLVLLEAAIFRRAMTDRSPRSAWE
ncbi:hypothetical protein J2W43_003034 [Pseudomonas brassicacearum]|uniref:Uncharacterized protein n=1 Tax=Pseudomonas brassicacearum TaxID=930166 RepID=A0AAW8MAA3_9PSED|nr:hypothetical protein [Pseudomonas brassicacearum]